MANPVFLSDVGVELVKHAASDNDVAWAARVSTQGELADAIQAQDPQSHKGLINFLIRDRHGSPFEHSSMTFRIHAPIFVMREFMRHRAGWSYNEESGRYRQLNPVFYVPDEDRKLVQTGKPGAYSFEAGSFYQQRQTQTEIKGASRMAYYSYELLLSQGIAREVARMVLPVNIFSSMYATCNARSLMHFLGLRTKHEDAKFPSFPQREIEMVAEKMEKYLYDLMPITYAAWQKNGRVSP